MCVRLSHKAHAAFTLDKTVTLCVILHKKTEQKSFNLNKKDMTNEKKITVTKNRQLI